MSSQKTILGWAKALSRALEGKSEKEKEAVFGRLVRIFGRKNKSYLLPGIFKKAGKIISRKKRLEITIARDQDSALVGAIKEKMRKIFGKDKDIKIKEDKEIIGGFRAVSEEFLVKAAAKDFLGLLKEKYQHGGN